MSVKKKFESRNGESSLVPSASQIPLVRYSPSPSGLDESTSDEYSNNGYLSSRATLTSHLDDSRDEVKIMMDNEGVKSSLDDSESVDSSDDSDSSGCLGCLDDLQVISDKFFNENKSKIKMFCYALLLVGYLVYFVWALVLDFQRATALFVITMLVVAGTAYGFIRDRFGGTISEKCFKPIASLLSKHWRILRWFIYVGLIASICAFLGVTIGARPRQYVSIAGLIFFFIVLFIFSKHPSKVNWRPVLWGFGLNFLFAILILKWSYGYKAFQFLGNEINLFLQYSDYGAKFVFGDKFTDHFFAFKVLPVIVFFSCAISTLYHLGAMQAIISKIAWLMQVTMGTAATESLSCASNIFVGQTEAPILIRPFLEKMTKSELHAVMTGGYATIAGGVLAAYILFGVSAEHLLCASVMNAPMALAASKLFYPETERSRTKNEENVVVDEVKCNNLLEAASAGASASIGLIANIAVNLIAFLAMLAFVNACLSWFGGMVGHPELSFQLICSYVFMPIAFLMGVDWEDAGIVAELLGTKTFLNEFVAYQELSRYIKNREKCVHPYISPRSEVICTYALCGFANLSSIGIQLGGIGSMVPTRSKDLAKLVIRALIAGTIACFMTACVAAVLVIEQPFAGCPFNATLNASLYNSSMNNSMFSTGVATATSTILDVLNYNASNLSSVDL